ncbi:hypothetical protein SapgrDRAFT_1508 [Saprospira grandis DSM 2844]|uniref:DUF3990 domain-containing protein n=1 Tax=Saprospira grandis DSM 2844 TaxID=694433 RepID=J0XW34_9BACT|nr:hypothetical protein [Saprospira grandis]EJF53221.1 hypothetical protein SapgrDRAFT_1508 [Saprospira grandis DSM 2844]
MYLYLLFNTNLPIPAKTTTVYHGTSKQDAESIIKTGFKSSTGNHHWLGDGVYFFTESATCPQPQERAEEWAIASAWDNGSHRYTEGAVLMVEVEIPDEDPRFYLDLNTPNGIALFNIIRDRFQELSFATAKRGFKPKEMFKDGTIINWGRNHLKFDFSLISGDFYVKNKLERIKFFNCRIPNSTFLVIFDTALIKSTTLIKTIPNIDKL